MAWKLRNGIYYDEEINAASIFYNLPCYTAAVDVQKNLTDVSEGFFFFFLLKK